MAYRYKNGRWKEADNEPGRRGYAELKANRKAYESTRQQLTDAFSEAEELKKTAKKKRLPKRNGWEEED